MMHGGVSDPSFCAFIHRVAFEEAFSAHRRIIFDGNGYSEEWEKEAARRGLLNLRTSVDAFKTFNDEKNVQLFSTHGVMSRVELESRQEILYENYSKIINIEALTMIDMASRDIIPAVNSYIGEVANTAAAKMSVLPTVNCSVERDLIERLSELNATAYRCVAELRAADKEATSIADVEKRAEACRDKVIPAMNALRAAVDEMETMTSSEYWPMPSYSDLMFNI